jgi:predicted transcriptional regulator
MSKTKRTILLSIHPEHAANILIGEKGFEFRRVCPRSEVGKIIIYATAPVGQVVGEADVAETIQGAPDEVWAIACGSAGITRAAFEAYYAGREKAVAYRLAGVRAYSEPRALSGYGVKAAPQSFVYL